MSEDWAWHSAAIAADAGVTKAEVLVAQRSLAAKGLARFTRGLLDEDGMAAGSGYFLTRAGSDWTGPDPALPRQDEGSQSKGGEE